MRISTRLFLAYLAVMCLCLYYPLHRMTESIGTLYREGVEDTLADQANILASVVEDEIRQHRFSPDQWQQIFTRVHARSFSARIYKLHKKQVDSHIYITDKQGIVLFDSENAANVGRDFSIWRDVGLTLMGEYGARTTRPRGEGVTSSTLYVAAPIYVDGVIAGVLTVGKPTTNILYFLQGARLNLLKTGALSLAVAGLLCFLVTLWLTRPIKRLTRYARSVRDGEHCPFPRLDRSEIGEMGRAFAEMQETLEGRRYVEQYVEHLTHELKSPLSAIRGAAELLGEPMDAAQQRRFIGNIESQSKRIQEIVDRMLELASLESRSFQRSNESVGLQELVQSVCAGKEPFMVARHLRFVFSVPENVTLQGDRFLLQQALANLLQNAIDFSPEGAAITVFAVVKEGRVRLAVCDEGPGIPEYARERVFDKFFSLQRPHSQQKSTGLGLNFVRQVALLHGGSVQLDALPQGGTQALFEVPISSCC